MERRNKKAQMITDTEIHKKKQMEDLASKCSDVQSRIDHMKKEGEMRSKQYELDVLRCKQFGELNAVRSKWEEVQQCNETCEAQFANKKEHINKLIKDINMKIAAQNSEAGHVVAELSSKKKALENSQRALVEKKAQIVEIDEKLSAFQNETLQQEATLKNVVDKLTSTMKMKQKEWKALEKCAQQRLSTKNEKTERKKNNNKEVKAKEQENEKSRGEEEERKMIVPKTNWKEEQSNKEEEVKISGEMEGVKKNVEMERKKSKKPQKAKQTVQSRRRILSDSTVMTDDGDIDDLELLENGRTTHIPPPKAFQDSPRGERHVRSVNYADPFDSSTSTPPSSIHDNSFEYSFNRAVTSTPIVTKSNRRSSSGSRGRPTRRGHGRGKARK